MLAGLTLALFGAELPLALPPWPIAYNTLGWSSIGRQLRALLVLSLPWLLTATVATYRLGTALSGRLAPARTGPR